MSLPLALLRFNTFLPLAVAILFLKPCSIFLWRFFGWYVLSILLHLRFLRRRRDFAPAADAESGSGRNATFIIYANPRVCQAFLPVFSGFFHKQTFPAVFPGQAARKVPAAKLFSRLDLQFFAVYDIMK